MADDTTDEPMYDENESTTDPKENPVSDGHLPVSGEVGGPVSYHDPATTDTNDDPDNDPVLANPENEVPIQSENPQIDNGSSAEAE